jgi:hypothetical protein
MLVRRFPAVVSVEYKGNLFNRALLTDEALRAVSGCNALTTLDLRGSFKVTDAGMRALSTLPVLTTLDIRRCSKVTAAGVQELRNTTGSPSLHIVR